MAFDIEVTLEDFVHDILPYLDRNPDLVTGIGNEQILYPCHLAEETPFGWLCKERNVSMTNTSERRTKEQPNVYFSAKKSHKFDIGKIEESLFFVIVDIGEDHYIALVVEKERQHIYTLDSAGVNVQNSRIINSVIGIDKYEIINASCHQSNVKISICNAYINAKLMIWEFQHDFKHEDLINEPISSISNCASMASMKLLVLDDTKEDVEEDGEEIVCDIIAESVRRGENIHTVLQEVSKLYELESAEKNFVKAKYVNYVVDWFLKNLEAHVSTINISCLKQWIEKSGCIKEFSCFDKIPGATAVQCCDEQNLFTRKDEQKFLDEIIEVCNLHLEKQMNTLQHDCQQFLRHFDEFLRNHYRKTLQIIPFPKKYLENGDVISWLRHIQIPNTQRLIDALENAMLTKTFEHFHQQLTSYLEVYNQKLRITKKTKTVIVVEGSFANTTELINLTEYNCDELQINISKLFVINSDVNLSGVNLVILADSVFISNNKEFTIDLSGNHGTNGWVDKAEDGQYKDADGESGENGANGESGGNVYIRANEIQNESNLTIKSNGGNGSNGQDGGNGRDGKDGKDGVGLVKTRFEREFPLFARFSAQDAFLAQCKIRDRIQLRSEDYLSDGFSVFGKSPIQDCHVEGKINIDGNYHDITFCNYTSVDRYSYLLVSGTHGSPGTNGGDGGKGGAGGCGGYHGNVNVEVLKKESQLPVIDDTPGAMGEAGKDGRGGKGGRNGIKGVNNLRIERGVMFDYRYYKGYLDVDYFENYRNDTVYCKLKDKYAGKRNLTSPTQSKQKDGKEGNVKKKQQNKEVRRKSPILVGKMANIHKEMLKQNSFQFEIQKESFNDEIETSKIVQKTRQNKVAEADDKDVAYKQQTRQLKYLFKKDIRTKKVKSIKKSTIKEFFKFSPISITQVDVKEFILTQNDCVDGSEYVEFLKKILNAPEFPKISNELLIQYLSTVKKNISLLKNPEIIKKCHTEIVKFKKKKSSWLFSSKKEKNLSTTLDQLLERIFEHYKLMNCEKIRQQLDTIIGIWMHASSELSDMIIIDAKVRTIYVDKLLTMLTSSSKDPRGFESVYRDSISSFEKSIHGMKDVYEIVTNDKLPSFLVGNNQLDDDAIEYHFENAEKQCEMDNIKFEDQGMEPIEVDTDDWEIISSHDNNALDSFIQNTDDISMNQDVRVLLRQLYYLKCDKLDIASLLNLILQRLKIGINGNEETLKWFILFSFEYTEFYGIDDILVIALTRPVEMWAFECLILQIVRRLQLTLKEELEFRSELKQFENINAFIRISQRIEDQSEDDTIRLADIISILRCCEDFDINNQLNNELREYTISSWPYRLQWIKVVKKLERLHISWTDESYEMNAVYLLTELRNTYGHELPDTLLQLLNSFSKIDSDDLLSMLQNFVNGYWRLENSILIHSNYRDFKQWMEFLGNEFSTNTERSLNDLVGLVNSDCNTSVKKKELTKAENLILAWDKQMHSSNDDSQIVRKLNKTEIKNIKWENLALKNIDRDITLDKIYCLALINQAVYLTNNFYLRYTQKLAIILFLISNERDRGMLQQLSTGEGKSIIIVVLSIFQVLCGNNVDIITSSSVLAKRDAEENLKLFELFGVAVGHNCSESIEVRKEVYSKKQVVYGEIGSFQRDILLDEFYNEDVGIGSREKGFVIIDEVDSMLLDKGQNVLYLSHSIPGMDKLESLYVFIWELVHAKDMIGSEENIQEILECVKSAIKERIRTNDLAGIVGEKLTETIWQKLIKERVIGKMGEIFNPKSFKESNFKEHPIKSIAEINKSQQINLLNYMKDIVRRGTEIVIPKFLQRFVDIHLYDWISNAFLARYMMQNDQYILDIDRSEGANSSINNIVIIDKDTGMEQYNSQWNNGMHQFLQLKHGCRISFESLKAVFMSNVSFFHKYDSKLFGLTGTLGSEIERNLLNEIYYVEYATIPSFRSSRFKEKPGSAQTDEKAWVESIRKSALQKKNDEDRPVLIICDSVKHVDKISNHFDSIDKVEVYKHSYERFKSSDSEIKSGKIIVSTNLAGRGTDLKISDKMNENGGLHVIISYIPKNLRIEQQAFGRSARKGQNGSGEIICFIDDSIADSDGIGTTSLIRVLQLKVERQNQEFSRIDTIKHQYENVTKYEEQYFARFSNAYKSLSRHLKVSKKYEEEEQSIRMKSCLDNWAFWLDEVVYNDFHQNDQENRESIKRADVASFLSRMHLIENPANLIKLAQHWQSKKKYEEAEKQLYRVIGLGDLSEVAWYYICYGRIREDGLNSENLPEIESELRKIEREIKEINQKMSSHSATVSLIAEAYRGNKESFLSFEDYKDQKQQMMQIYDTFKGSITDIFGDEVTLFKLSLQNDMKLPDAWRVYHDLLERNVFTRAYVRRAITSSSEAEEVLKEKYALYFNEIVTTLNECPRKVTLDSLKKILPSKEELWEMMEKENLIKKVKTFAVVKKDSMKENGGWLELKNKTEIENESEKFFNKLSTTYKEEMTIYMHPEYREEVKNGTIQLVPIRNFECLIKPNYQSFLDKAEIKVTNVAILDTSKDVRLSKYDGISHLTFTEIHGINEESSEEIFQNLVENKVVTSNGKLLVTDISKEFINMSTHHDYEAEIFSVLQKHFQYRLAINAYKENDRILLENLPHSLLIEDLLLYNIIEPSRVSNDKSVEEIEKIIDLFYEKDIRQGKIPEKFVQSLKSTVTKWKGEAYKLNEVDANLRDIRELFPENENHEIQGDLANIINNGFSHIIVLGERKWTLIFGLKIGAILLIGLAQIVLGVVLELLFAGGMTLFASGLIGEGIGDIMYAIECAATGYCTWTAYYLHKKISLTVTILSCGIGAYMAGGAKFSKFGYKIGAEYLQNLSGKKLVQEIGKKAATKATAIRVAKKVAEAAGLGLANLVVDNIFKIAVNTATEKLIENCISDVVKKVNGNTKMKENLERICQNVGVNKAETIVSGINKIMRENDQKGWFSTVTNHLKTVVGCICRGINEASRKVGASGGHISKLASDAARVTTFVMKCGATAKSVCEILTFVDSYLSTFCKHLEEKMYDFQANESVKEKDKNEIEDFKYRICKEWENQLTTQLREKLWNELLGPVTKYAAHNATLKIGKSIQKHYAKHQQRKLWNTFQKLRQQNDRKNHQFEENLSSHDSEHNEAYIDQIMKLLKKTRDPELYAELIKEGTPGSVHCAQAMSDMLGKQIIIKLSNGAQPLVLNPSEGNSKEGEVIHLWLDVARKHFTVEGDHLEEIEYSGNDCLFNAIKKATGKKISREDVANHIVKDERIRKHIEMQIHEHFFSRGKYGGVIRGKAQKEFINDFKKHCREKQKQHMPYEEMLTTLRNAHGAKKGKKRKETIDERNKDTKDDEKWVKRRLRDPAKSSNKIGKRSGNDEIFPLQHLRKAYERGQTGENTFTDIDIVAELRLDTQFVIFDTKNDGVNGHTGTAYNNKCPKTQKLTGPRTKGQKALHDDRFNALQEGKTPMERFIKGLEKHLQQLVYPDVLRKKVIEYPIYTVSHNLMNNTEREEFCVGYEREFSKVYLAIEAAKVGEEVDAPRPELLNGNDEYVNYIKSEIQKVTHDCSTEYIEDITEILRKPAPYKYEPKNK